MKDKQKLIAGSVILVLTIALGVWQFMAMQDFNARTDVANTTAANLTKTSKELTQSYQDIKVDVVSARDEAEQSLRLVFPTDENLTDLNRMFDDFSTRNNFKSSPFFMSSVKYGQAEETEEGYRFVPVDVTVESSKRNLNKFLEFIEQSGSLENEVRLMDIQNMVVTYPDEFGGTYKVRFTLNAYFSQDLN